MTRAPDGKAAGFAEKVAGIARLDLIDESSRLLPALLPVHAALPRSRFVLLADKSLFGAKLKL